MDKEYVFQQIVGLLGFKHADQIRIAIGLADNLSSTTDLSLVCGIDSANTVDECWNIYRNTPASSEAKKQALEKIKSLLMAELEAAKTVEQCQDIYLNALLVIDVREKALEKALSLTTTIQECRDLFQKTSIHSYDSYSCIRRIAELLKTK